ncbi:MAG TPA: hypothetical protein VJ183_16090 [Chloroflexia bacterium]|nr:hypothetical protein [Chloroflexia bacterium]
MKVKSLLGALVMLLLTASVALAWPEGPPDKVSINGPGIKGTIVIADKNSLEGLGPEQFMDFSKSVTAVPQNSTPYEVVRYIKGFGASGTFDRLHYYPGQGGSAGRIYYVEAIGYGPSHVEGKWFYATPQGDAAMKKLLAKYTSKSEAATAKAESAPNGRGQRQSPRQTLMIAY